MRNSSGVVSILVTSGVLFWSSISQATGLGPYEDRIASGNTYVGLLRQPWPARKTDSGQGVKVSDMQGLHRSIEKTEHYQPHAKRRFCQTRRTWYWVYFDYKGKDYLKAVNAFEKAAPGTSTFIDPHPRAKTYGTSWLQMEWICYIRGVMDSEIPAKSKAATVTRVIPEREELYRTLHQTVWPGVIDQLARTNNRNLSIFLAEIGDEIYEFLYLEYVGNDAAADGKSSKSDPCTLRWWKLTDACQDPLPEVKTGTWAGMDTVVK